MVSYPRTTWSHLAERRFPSDNVTIATTAILAATPEFDLFVLPQLGRLNAFSQLSENDEKN